MLQNDDLFVLKIGGVAVLIGMALYIGLIAFLIIAPIIAGAHIVNMLFRSRYDANMRQAKVRLPKMSAPQITVEVIINEDGDPMISWNSTKPQDSTIAIYRLAGQTSTDLDYIDREGTLLITTRHRHSERVGLFYDYEAPKAMVFYVPVIFGEETEKWELAYKNWSFSTKPKFSERKEPYALVGQSTMVRVPKTPPSVSGINDGRSDLAKLKDQLVTKLDARKSKDAELDTLIAEIEANSDYSEDEKVLLIEELEVNA